MLSSTNSDGLDYEREYVLKAGTRQRPSRHVYVLTPKNKTEQKRIEREIRKTGTFKADYTVAEEATTMSPITETPLIVDEAGDPIRSEKKAKTRSLRPAGSNKTSRARGTGGGPIAEPLNENELLPWSEREHRKAQRDD